MSMTGDPVTALGQWMSDMANVRADADSDWKELHEMVGQAIAAIGRKDLTHAGWALERACDLEYRLTGDSDSTAELCRLLALDPEAKPNPR